MGFEGEEHFFMYFQNKGKLPKGNIIVWWLSDS